jgi:hypothetical protein
MIMEVATALSAKWRAAAALVAVLPAAGAAYGAREIINVFRAMAVIGSGGVGAVSMGISESNRPLMAAAVAAAAISGFLAVALARKPAQAAAFPGLPFSLLAGLACVPALILWAAESFSLDVLANRVTGPVAGASQHLANLLIGTVALAVGVILLTVALWVLSPVSRTSCNPSAWPRVAAWAGAVALLLCLAALFYVRSSYLSEVAVRGHF